jgi:hypothetical protein
MQRKALTVSILIHAALLLPFVVPQGATNAEAQQPTHVSILAPLPSRKSKAEDRMNNGKRVVEVTAPVDLPAVPNSLIVVIDKQGFANIFQAAELWGATLRSGVPYSDPGTYDIYFCDPQKYSRLSGTYAPGDLAWFAFPQTFQQRILERLSEYIRQHAQRDRRAQTGARCRRGHCGGNGDSNPQ